jgi:hypothetical protein
LITNIEHLSVNMFVVNMALLDLESLVSEHRGSCDLLMNMVGMQSLWQDNLAEKICD